MLIVYIILMMQPAKNLYMESMGKKNWVIPEGYIPSYSNGPEPELTSHEAFCILNTGPKTAVVQITIFYEDREPVGPYIIKVSSRRTLHFRFNNLQDPEPVPLGTRYSSLFESNVPIVVQHTRLDSRQAENALLTTIAYGQ